MAEERIPTTEDVREAYVASRATGDSGALPCSRAGEATARAEFSEWLTGQKTPFTTPEGVTPAAVLAAHGSGAISWLGDDGFCATCQYIGTRSDDVSDSTIENVHIEAVLTDAGLLLGGPLLGGSVHVLHPSGGNRKVACSCGWTPDEDGPSVATQWSRHRTEGRVAR